MELYSEEEVEAVVEGYSELDSVRYKPFIQVRLLDLERVLPRLSLPYRQAILLCGMVGLTTRTAGRLVGVSAKTMHKRYRRALREILRQLNTGGRR